METSNQDTPSVILEVLVSHLISQHFSTESCLLCTLIIIDRFGRKATLNVERVLLAPTRLM